MFWFVAFASWQCAKMEGMIELPVVVSKSKAGIFPWVLSKLPFFSPLFLSLCNLEIDRTIEEHSGLTLVLITLAQSQGHNQAWQRSATFALNRTGKMAKQWHRGINKGSCTLKLKCSFLISDTETVSSCSAFSNSTCLAAAGLIAFSSGKCIQKWSNNRFAALIGRAKTNSSTDQQPQLPLVALHRAHALAVEASRSKARAWQRALAAMIYNSI